MTLTRRCYRLYPAYALLVSLCAASAAVSAVAPGAGQCPIAAEEPESASDAIAAQETEATGNPTSLYVAIAKARAQPASVLTVNPQGRVRAATLWLNVGEPLAARVLKGAIEAAQKRRLNIRLIAFGDDPAITGRSTLFHMIAEKNRLGRHPQRLLTLLEEVQRNDYFTLVDRHREIPACMRVAAQNRIALDLHDAQQELRRLDRSALLFQ